MLNHEKVEENIFLSLIIISRNNPSNLINSVNKNICYFDKIIIWDSSDEETHDKLSNYFATFRNVIFVFVPPLGIVEPYREIAIKHYQSEWIAFLDDDELFSDSLLQDLKGILHNMPTSFSAVQTRRICVKNDRILTRIEYLGCSKDYQVRIIRRADAHYFGYLHEKPSLKGKLKTLDDKYSIIHFISDAGFYDRRKRLIYWIILRRENFISLLQRFHKTPSNNEECPELPLFLYNFLYRLSFLVRVDIRSFLRLPEEINDFLKLLRAMDPKLKEVTYSIFNRVQKDGGVNNFLNLLDYEDLFNTIENIPLNETQKLLYLIAQRLKKDKVIESENSFMEMVRSVNDYANLFIKSGGK